MDSFRAQESVDILKISRKWLKKILEGGSQKVQTPRPPPIGPIHTSIDSSRSQDSEYMVFIWIDPPYGPWGLL